MMQREWVGSLFRLVGVANGNAFQSKKRPDPVCATPPAAHEKSHSVVLWLLEIGRALVAGYGFFFLSIIFTMSFSVMPPWP